LILLTTSRRPTERIRTFCRDLASSIPDVVRVNRGKMSLDGVGEKAIELDADKIIIVDRWHGGHGKISLFQISTGLKPIMPKILLSNIRLKRELNKSTSRICASAITVSSNVPSGIEEAAESLSKFLSLPLLSLDDAVKAHCVSLHFLVDSSQKLIATFVFLGRMVEIGPRLTLSGPIWKDSL
jgi:U3 small nucleolar ribonucleoprotein protein IMP4